MKGLKQMKISDQLKPIEILRKYGHIVKTRDGYFLRYFANSLGDFLFYDNFIGVVVSDSYDEHLFHNEIPTGDIVEIYNVKDCVYFFGKDLFFFKNRLDMIEQGMFNDDVDIIELVYKRE